MNVQQFTQLLKAVERQTYGIISSQLTQVMAFHDPVKGIKNMFTEEINKLHETIKGQCVARNREMFREMASLSVEAVTIPRNQSLNDLSKRQIHP
jgi:hypothetical protein